MTFTPSQPLPGSKLLALATAYCDQHDMAETTFGRHAVGDPRLIGDLRRGRQPTKRLSQRVLAFMDGKPMQGDKAHRYVHRTDDPHPLLADMARFMLATGVSDTMLGLRALGDPNFVEDVRCGRDVRRQTERRVREYMEGRAA